MRQLRPLHFGPRGAISFTGLSENVDFCDLFPRTAAKYLKIILFGIHPPIWPGKHKWAHLRTDGNANQLRAIFL